MAKRKRDKNAVVKTLKIELVDVLNYEPPPKKDGEEYSEKEKRRELIKELRRLQRKVAQASNYISREYFLWELKRREAEEKGIILNEKQELGTTLQNKGYRIAAEVLKGFNTENIAVLSSQLWENWKKRVSDVFNGSMSLPSYGQKQPIPINKKNYNIIPYKNNKYMIEITFYSPSEGRNRKLQFITANLNDYSQNIIKNILSQKYRKGSANFIIENNPNKNLSSQKIFFHISYEFIPQPQDESTENILGIDLGLKNVVAMQVYNPKKQEFEYIKYNDCIIEGGELVAIKRKIEALKHKKGKATKWKGEGNTGHGRKKKMKMVYSIGKKISQIKNTYNNKIAKYIIDFALKHQCKYIKMEKLTSHGFENTLLQEWRYYDLQTKIKNKAKENGITVLFVNPKYTSQKCSVCGYINSENRKTRDNFKCTKCDNEMDADINAARNIAVSEDIIKEDDEED